MKNVIEKSEKSDSMRVIRSDVKAVKKIVRILSKGDGTQAWKMALLCCRKSIPGLPPHSKFASGS